MSGHSKWAGIKHKKAIIDAKRGKVFTRVVRELTIAAKQGGNSESNARLRKAIEDAKAANMPAENVKKAIQRGTGELPGVTYEELVYEGYGPSGVAIMVEVTTDNKNRTHSEIKKIFSSHGGNLGESGCVNWMFQPKGYIAIDKSKAKEDELMNIAIENGAEDVKTEDENLFEIITHPADFEKVKKALTDNKIEIEAAENTMLPTTYIQLEGNDARKMLELIDEMEGHDDVKNVYSNFEIVEEPK
ncbi:MAG: transcriptional regulator [Elusimicrobia bacterium RIFOXYD2_FULL_34_15]|nr:MAG: transcriptional regulator [Elusimicrobia bacterium RIFOXYD2_FULL_34_15]